LKKTFNDCYFWKKIADSFFEKEFSSVKSTPNQEKRSTIVQEADIQKIFYVKIK